MSASVHRAAALAGLVLVLPSAHAWAQSASAAATDASDSLDPPQTVLVTARQRTEDAQDVPIALSVLSGNSLESTDSYTLADIQQQVPGFMSYDVNPRNSSIGIRGLGVTSAQDGMDTSVGVYVDNVYLGRPGMALEDLVDVDNVEILRGPQGTLFGRNNSAGAVLINTNEPSFTPSLTSELSLGDYAYNQERLALTGPLIDDVAAFRVTAYNTYRQGWLDNTTTGGTNNGIERGGTRAQLLLTPGGGVTVRIIADYSVEDDSADTDVIKTILPPSLGPSIAQAETALGKTGWTPTASLTTTGVNSPQEMRTRQGGFSSQLDWQLGWGQFTSISAYRLWDFFPLQDSDYTPLDIFEVNTADTHDEQVTQEFRLASKAGVFDWQTGAYFFDEDLHDRYILHQYGYDSSAYYTNYDQLTNPDASVVEVAQGAQYIDNVATDAYSGALFGQANWSLTDALTLTGGLRYTLDRRTGTALSATVREVPASLATPIDYDLAVDGHDLSSLGSLSYRLSRGSLLYASYSTGYTAAGLNLDSAAVPVNGLVLKPETVTSYETGIKQGLWGGRITVNADLYWTELQGLQANYYPPDGAKSYLTNVGNVRARGAELEASLALGGLSLHASGAYNDAAYTSYPDAPCPVGINLANCVLTGLPLYEAPRWIGNATAEYAFGATAAGLRPYVLGQYSYTSSYFGTIDDSPYNEISSYGVANLRIGVRNDKYDLSLWANNVFNKLYFTSLGLATVNASWGVAGLPGDPRTVGLMLKAYF
jgi:iron complex outermembrane receptor protein